MGFCQTILLNNPAIMVSKNLSKILWTACLKVVFRFSKLQMLFLECAYISVIPAFKGGRQKFKLGWASWHFADYILYSVSGELFQNIYHIYRMHLPSALRHETMSWLIWNIVGFRFMRQESECSLVQLHRSSHFNHMSHVQRTWELNVQSWVSRYLGLLLHALSWTFL